MYKILLVEDNPINCRLVHRRLGDVEAFQIREAHDGKTAIRIAYHHLPDLILMDMSLPEMDGWEATSTLRNTDKTRDIPIIALTAHAMEKDRIKAADVGCDGFVPKPINFKILRPMMEKLIRNGRNQPQES